MPLERLFVTSGEVSISMTTSRKGRESVSQGNRGTKKTFETGKGREYGNNQDQDHEAHD